MVTKSAARTNERERNRIQNMNIGYARLRDHIVRGTLQSKRNNQKSTKRLSKLEIISMAIDYIRSLENTLANSSDNSNKSTLSNTRSMTTPSESASPSTNTSNSQSSPMDASSITNTYSSQSSPMDDTTRLYADEGIMEAINWWNL